LWLWQRLSVRGLSQRIGSSQTVASRTVYWPLPADVAAAINPYRKE